MVRNENFPSLTFKGLHVLDHRFDRGIDFDVFVNKVLTHCPQVRSHPEAKLMLREMFLSHYKLFDFYDVNLTEANPFASSCIHPAEDRSELWYYGDLMFAYTELSIYDIFKISYSEFINQPKPIIDEQTMFAKFYITRKNKLDEEMLAKLNKK